jgi:hypothetical protein
LRAKNTQKYSAASQRAKARTEYGGLNSMNAEQECFMRKTIKLLVSKEPDHNEQFEYLTDKYRQATI